MEQKRVFITGGTGFVGLNIAELLLKEGWMVVLYARKSLDERIVRELDGLAGQLVLEFGDVLDQKRIEEILKKYRISYVIHGAAITPDERAEADQPVTIMEVNCIGLMHSLLAAKNQGIRRFFYLGSISAYGQTAFSGNRLVPFGSDPLPHASAFFLRPTGRQEDG